MKRLFKTFKNIKLQGRILWKQLSFLDMMVGIFVLLVLIGYFVIFDRSKADIYIDAVYDELTWDSSTNPPDKWQGQKIVVGDKAYNSVGRQVAEVTQVTKTVVAGGNYELTYLTLKLKATYNKNTKTYTLDGRSILVGNRLTINTPKVALNIRILDVYSNLEDKYKDFKKVQAVVTLISYGNEPWIVEKMKKFTVKNREGKTILEIQSSEVIPSETVSGNAAGQLVRTFNPLKRDIIMKMKLSDVLCKETSCFFNQEIPLMIGGPLWADSGNMVIGGNTAIMDIEIIEE